MVRAAFPRTRRRQCQALAVSTLLGWCLLLLAHSLPSAWSFSAKVACFVGMPSSTHKSRTSLQSVIIGRAALDTVVESKQTSYDILSGIELPRASDGSSISLTDMWKADEKAVVVFLRHFG